MILLSCQLKTETHHQYLPSGMDDNSITYWDVQRKGTNYFNGMPTEEWFVAARRANIKFVRLVYEKWKGERTDFLLGNADNYQGIVESDFKQLKHFLDYADQLDIKIVLTPISLPGARWKQMNNNKRDTRLWTDERYQQQAIQFWKDLAEQLKDHPAIVGYNIMNEPHPEMAYGKYSFWDGKLLEWYQEVKGGAGDLNLFYSKIVEAIRKVDAETPIILESGLYATPWAFDYLKPLDDENIIYSFHMYEPYEFTTKRMNKDRFSYSNSIPIDGLAKDFQLKKEGLSNFLKPINRWSEKHQIPSNRIWVGEFGCNRHINGVEEYLQDLISIFNEYQWHWSFYAYREDTWEGMDYELGTARVFYKYWDYEADKTLHLHYEDIYGKVKNPALWEVFKAEFD